MDLELRGKTALVTGASKGIGLAIARALASEGCNLHLAARSSEDLARARDAIAGEAGVGVNCHALDLARSDAVGALAAACTGIDILVNNAGAIQIGRAHV